MRITWRSPVAVVLAFSALFAVLSFLPALAAKDTPSADAPAKVERPADWASKIEKPGCPNLHRVSDTLYRGAQPTEEGFRQLKEMGIKTIVNLRSFHSDRDEMADTKFSYEHITMKPWHPEHKETVRFLKIVTDKSRAPVFVHCQRGADRTGTMCAIYRIVVCGWSKDKALDELRNGGFEFYEGWKDLVEYLKELNVEQVRKEAGIAAQGQPNKP